MNAHRNVDNAAVLVVHVWLLMFLVCVFTGQKYAVALFIESFDLSGLALRLASQNDDLIAFAQLALELGLRIVLFEFLGLHCEEPT